MPAGIGLQAGGAWILTLLVSLGIGLIQARLTPTSALDWLECGTVYTIFIGGVFFPITVPLLITVIVMTVLAIRKRSRRLVLLACGIFALYWQGLVLIACTIPAR